MANPTKRETVPFDHVRWHAVSDQALRQWSLFGSYQRAVSEVRPAVRQCASPGAGDRAAMVLWVGAVNAHRSVITDLRLLQNTLKSAEMIRRGLRHRCARAIGENAARILHLVETRRELVGRFPAIVDRSIKPDRS